LLVNSPLCLPLFSFFSISYNPIRYNNNNETGAEGTEAAAAAAKAAAGSVWLS